MCLHACVHASCTPASLEDEEADEESSESAAELSSDDDDFLFFLLSFFLAFFDFDLLSVTESLAPFSAALKSSEQTVSSLSSDPSLSHTKYWRVS